MSNLEEIVAKVKKIIFSSNDSDFYILSCCVDDDELIVLGNFDNIDEDFIYQFNGEFVEHKQYGMQFKAYTAQLVMPNDEDLLISYLSSKQFTGIGKKIAKRIYELYKDSQNILEDIVENSSLLDNVKGLSKNNAVKLVEVLKHSSQYNKLFDFLKEYNIDYNNVFNLYNKTKLDVDEFILLLKNNPYYLMKYHISFKQIDQIARLMDLNDYEFHRRKGLLYGTIKNLSFRIGATYLYREQVLDSNSELSVNFEEVLEELVKENLIVVKDDIFFEREQYNEEIFIAEFIKDYSRKIENNNIDEYVNDYQKYYGIHFNAEQYQALSNAINIPISIITGGPGTGKSTIVDALIFILNKIDKNYQIGLCAPTGKASKRLAQLTGKEAMTIHRLLKYDMISNTFGHNVYNPLEYDVLIVDESSMIDNLLMGSLLKASFNVKKIVFLGDYNQLPSVSQGQVLKDLIDSEVIATTSLTKIYRQKEGSSIIELAYQILNHHHLSNNIINEDLKFISLSDEYNIMKLLVYYAKNYTNKDIQILAPIYKGRFGIDNINKLIQKIKYKKDIERFNDNDLVLQLKNRNRDEIYNGEVGTVESIGKSIRVAFDDKTINYSLTEAEELALAYCISIHKAQGNEYDEIILFIPSNSMNFIDNKILYTAITRPKKKLWIISDLNTVNNAIDLTKTRNRQTKLKDLLNE